MSDGNNQEALAQAQAKIEELQSEITKATKVISDSQEMIQRQSAEVGDDRKAIKESNEAIRKLTAKLVEATEQKAKLLEDLEAARTLLAEAKKQGPREGREQSPPPPEQTADEIEASLTEAEQKKLDEAWKNADEAMKRRIRSDEATRKAFLQEAKDQARDDVESDLSDWRKKPAREATPGGGAEDIRKLFKREQRAQAKRIPDGPAGGGGRDSYEHRRPQPNQKTSQRLIG